MENFTDAIGSQQIDLMVEILSVADARSTTVARHTQARLLRMGEWIINSTVGFVASVTLEGRFEVPLTK